MTIDLREWFEILSMYKHRLKLEKAIDKYTNANWIHFWCIMGHTELLQKILEIDSSLSSSKDESGNTPLHYLWQNTVSKSSDIVTMWRWLVSHGAKIKSKNNLKLSCMDVLKQRIKAKNPYDELAKHKDILKSLWNK